jgi:hypothetical protein
VIHQIAISNSSLIVSAGADHSAIGIGTSSSPVGSLSFTSDCFIECQSGESPTAIQASSILVSNSGDGRVIVDYHQSRAIVWNNAC